MQQTGLYYKTWCRDKWQFEYIEFAFREIYDKIGFESFYYFGA